MLRAVGSPFHTLLRFTQSPRHECSLIPSCFSMTAAQISPEQALANPASFMVAPGRCTTSRCHLPMTCSKGLDRD